MHTPDDDNEMKPAVTRFDLRPYASHCQSTDMKIGRRLQMRRLEQDAGQDTLAEVTGISVQTIDNYEQGNLRMTPEHLIALSKSLDVNVSFFFRS